MLSAEQALKLTKSSKEELEKLKIEAFEEEEKRIKEMSFRELKELETRIEKYAKLGETNLFFKVEWTKYGNLTQRVITEISKQLRSSGYTIQADDTCDSRTLYISWGG